jgi:hypothetical protein
MSFSSIDAVILNEKNMRHIDLFLEEYYESGKTQEIAEVLVQDKMNKNQVRGLENIIVSTTRFSEIINYIKNQIGKQGRSQWQNAGPTMLRHLTEIEQKAGELSGDNPAEKVEIKLRLARGWAKQVAAHYYYARLSQGENNGTQ